MSFRRTGHSDERRRRVLMDDSTATDAPAPTRSARERKGAKPRNYSDAALAAQQPPLTSLIPSRLWTLSVLLLSALTVVALLNLLHAELPRLARWFGPGQIDPFHFAVRGNLAAWFSALLLGWGAAMSAHIYNLRRHRVDDYKGRYRIWIWTTLLLIGASIDAATGLHDAIGGALVKLAGEGAAFSVSAGWLMVASAVISTVALRMAIEMRHSFGALFSLALALACYAAAAATRVGLMPLEGELAWHALVTATLLGHVFLWFTALAYAAHVYLDAQGLLAIKPPQAARPKKKKDAGGDDEATSTSKAEASESDAKPSGKQLRVDAAHGGAATAKPAASSGGPLKAMVSSAALKSPPESAAHSKLSKTERKRLRRQGRPDDDDE
jgi:hypothetical protein